MKYASVLAAIKKLATTRAAYLEATGWALRPDGRWWKDFPWGTASQRRVEGDLLDAVGWQAKYDGETE